MAKYHRMGGLNSRHLSLTVPEVGKSKVKMPAYLVSLESSLLVCGWSPSSSILACLRKKTPVSLPILIRALITLWWLHPYDVI